jgi:hypothetical protein
VADETSACKVGRDDNSWKSELQLGFLQLAVDPDSMKKPEKNIFRSKNEKHIFTVRSDVLPSQEASDPRGEILQASLGFYITGE